jgi:hypothetical protein
VAFFIEIDPKAFPVEILILNKSRRNQMKIEAIILLALLLVSTASAEHPSTLTDPNALKMSVIEPGFSGAFIIFQNENGTWVVGYAGPGRDTKFYLGNETGYVAIRNNQTDTG